MQRKLTLLASAAVALLCACGGGSPTANNPLGGSDPAVAIITASTPSTYAGEELAAFNAFNAARETCGFGSLQQNAAIDAAARNHVAWMIENNRFDHIEAASTPGFTGQTVGERLDAAGYTGWVRNGEVLTAQPGRAKSGFGLQGARNLLGAPYHLMGLMQGNREIGISVKSGGPIGSGADISSADAVAQVWFTADMAASNTLEPQSQATADVLTYPCQGISNTAYKLTNESPSPIPSRNLASNPIGQPVFVQVLAGQTLSITTASIVTTAGSNPVPIAVTLTAENDPNGELDRNQAVIIPNVPLATNTQYTVTLDGSNNGARFLKSFTFTTGT